MTTEKSSADRYHEAAHAMQTGVAFSMEIDATDTTPKHLRVGVNSAMVSQRGLVDLLKEKGIISEEEYVDAVAVAMEEEARRYADSLSKHYGRPVNLT